MDPNSRIVGSLLTELEEGHGISQRALAWRCGIALGRANLLLRAVVGDGLVAVSGARPKYVLTARGQARKADLDRERLKETIELYHLARRHIEQRLGRVFAGWPPGCPKRVALVGAGLVAEVVFACIQRSEVQVTAVFDMHQAHQGFFGFEVQPMSEIKAMDPDHPVLVTCLDSPRDLAAVLRSLGVMSDRLMWL